MWSTVNLDQSFQVSVFLLLGIIHGDVEINTGPNRRRQAGRRTVKIRLLPIHILLNSGRARHQIHLQRAVGHLANGQADDPAERVADLLQLRDVHRVLINIHPDERVEVLDRHLKLLREELRQIRHDRRATVQEHPYRVAAALLLLPELHRLFQLHVHTGHHLTGYFRNRRLMRILRLGVRASQADQTLLQLDLLRLRKTHLRFRRELLRDRVGADIDGANEKFLAFEEQDVRCLGADVQHHRASVNVAVIVAEGVYHCRLRRVHQFHVHTLRLGQLDHPVRNLTLERGQQHLDLARLGHAHRVVIPSGLLQRERDILLRLELDELRDLGLVDRRQADRLGQNLKTGSRHQAALGRKTGLLEHFVGRLLHRLGPCPLAGTLQPQRLDPKTKQANAALRRGLELSGTQGAGAHVNCKEGFRTHFISIDWTSNHAHPFNNSRPRQLFHSQKSGWGC